MLSDKLTIYSFRSAGKVIGLVTGHSDIEQIHIELKNTSCDLI